MRLLLWLAFLPMYKAQTCGCPAGFYGGYYSGAQPSLIWTHDGSNWQQDVIKTAGHASAYRQCTGYSRLCKNGGSPCADWTNDWSSAGTVRGNALLGHAKCQIENGVSDQYCDWNRAIAATDPDPGNQKYCYCYSCFPCPAGTYSATTHVTSISQCLNCPANTWSYPGSTHCHWSFPNTTINFANQQKYDFTGFVEGYSVYDTNCGSWNAVGCKSNWIDWTGSKQNKHFRDWHGGGGRSKRHTWLACPTCMYKEDFITNNLAGASLQVGFHEAGWGTIYAFCYDSNSNSRCDIGSSTEHGPGWRWQWGWENFWGINSGGTYSSVISGPYGSGGGNPPSVRWRTTRMFVDFVNNKLYYYIQTQFAVEVAKSGWIPIKEQRGVNANLNFGANSAQNPEKWNAFMVNVDSDMGSVESPTVAGYPKGSYLNTSTGIADACPINTYCTDLVQAKACPTGTYQPGAVATACTTCPGGAQSTPNLARACGANKNSACTATESTTLAGSNGPGVITDGNHQWSSHTGAQVSDSWVRIDMESSKSIRGGMIWHRQDCCPERTNGYKIWIGDSNTYNGAGNVNCFTATTLDHTYYPFVSSFVCNGVGRYLFFHLPSANYLSLTEIEIYPSLPYTGTAIDICGCPAGKYFTAGGCQDCPVGSYTSSGGALSCTPCPQYSYTPSTGSTACTQCSAHV